jgi:hypothetical protein
MMNLVYKFIWVSYSQPTLIEINLKPFTLMFVMVLFYLYPQQKPASNLGESLVVGQKGTHHQKN